MRSLEQIHQSNNVPMLAPFQNVKFPLLLSHLHNFHACLLYCFDCNKLSRLKMIARANLSKLTLAQRATLVERVKIEKGSIASLVT
jgi:hypothetical protein